MGNAIESAPASQWAGLFSNLLTTAVDTGSKLAIANADTKQKEALAEQQTEVEKAKANAAVATASAANANASTNWQRIALYAGIAIVGIGAVALLVKTLKK
mgnify:CR=1 FL=1